MTDPRPKRQCTLKRPPIYDDDGPVVDFELESRKQAKKQKIMHANITTIPAPTIIPPTNTTEFQKKLNEIPSFHISSSSSLLNCDFQPMLMSDNYFPMSTIDDNIEDPWKLVSDMPCFDGSIAFSNVPKIQITDLDELPLSSSLITDGLERDGYKNINTERVCSKEHNPILRVQPPPPPPSFVIKSNAAITKIQHFPSPPPPPFKVVNISRQPELIKSPNPNPFGLELERVIVKTSASLKKPPTIFNIDNNNNLKTLQAYLPNTIPGPSLPVIPLKCDLNETPLELFRTPCINRTLHSENRSEDLRIRYNNNNLCLWDGIFGQYPEASYNVNHEKRATIVKTYILTFFNYHLVRLQYPKSKISFV